MVTWERTNEAVTGKICVTFKGRIITQSWKEEIFIKLKQKRHPVISLRNSQLRNFTTPDFIVGISCHWE